MEDVRDHLKRGEVFYYADEFNVSWLPTLRAMWSPKGEQIMIPTPSQPSTHYGIGAVKYHTGEDLAVIVRRHKRRCEIVELLQTLLDKHPHETVYIAWAYASTHEDDEIEALVRGRQGRPALLYLLTYSPWLNPIETPRGLPQGGHALRAPSEMKGLTAETLAFCKSGNDTPKRVLSVMGSNAA